jgi:hypothetical protein
MQATVSMFNRCVQGLSWAAAALGALSMTNPTLFGSLPPKAQAVCLALGALGIGRAHFTAPKDAPLVAQARASMPPGKP